MNFQKQNEGRAVMEVQEDKNIILNIIKECPEITFDNIGYQYLSLEVKEKYKNQITIIENILKKYIDRFSKFDNFKPRKDGTVVIRCQYGWDEKFIGVGYFNVDDIFRQNNKN